MSTQVAPRAGLEWFIGDEPEHDDWLGPEHEATIENRVLELLPPPYQERRYPDGGGVLLDIGAHVGHYTLRAAAAGHRVIAVEANPETAGRLFANVVLNNLDSYVRIIPHPAWDQNESMTWKGHGRSRNASGQVRPDALGKLWPVVLDDVLGNERRIDAVKIDTEGCEMQVLRGLRATLKRCRPALWIEDHAWLGLYSTEELHALMREVGYSHLDGGTWSGLQYWQGVPAPEPLRNVALDADPRLIHKV